MNRLIINGVTIEYPEDSSLTVNGSFVSIRHTARKEVNARVPEIEFFNDIPKITHPPLLQRGLPKDIDKIIIRFMREHQGKQYAIGISKMIGKLLNCRLDYRLRVKVHNKLDEMVEVGVLVILAKTPHALYGLAAMQQLPVTDDKPDEHPTEYVNG